MKIINKLLVTAALIFCQGQSFAFQLSIEAITTTALSETPLTIVPVPKQSSQYFIVSSAGTISLLDVATPENATSLVFDAKKILPAFVELSAFTLHPNFNIRDQQGHLTFYTAHNETVAADSKRSTLTDKSLDCSQIQSEAVVTEWQLDENLAVDLISQRQVIRVKSPTSEPLITQLAFNANLKVWHEQFGLLFLGLNSVAGFKDKPLYSGAVLRINPEQFGLKNYTVPANNPYKNHDAIADEIALYNLNELGSFHWSKKDNNQLVIDHSTESKRQLSQALVDGKSNTLHQLIALPQSSVGQHQAGYYFGKQFSYLYGSLIVSAQQNDRWQIQSIDQANNAKLTTLWPIDTQQRSLIFTDHQGELLIFNGDTMQLLQLVNIEIPGQEGSQNFETPTQSQSSKVLVFVILVGGILWLIIKLGKRSYREKTSATNHYRQQFTHFECSADKQVLHIFRHHQTTPSHSVHIHQLTQCSVLINEQTVHSITRSIGMSNDVEQVIREAFNIEKREKMVPNKQRLVRLNLIDESDTTYSIYLYLRKGDSRISKMKYEEVCDYLIDWCWQLAAQIAPAHTEQRKQIVKKTPLPNATKRPIKKVVPASPAVKSATSDETPMPAQARSTTEKSSLEQSHLDTEIVSALEKLAKLKAQGYLSDAEFEQAKAKLLNDLI